MSLFSNMWTKCVANNINIESQLERINENNRGKISRYEIFFFFVVIIVTLCSRRLTITKFLELQLVKIVWAYYQRRIRIQILQ